MRTLEESDRGLVSAYYDGDRLLEERDMATDARIGRYHHGLGLLSMEYGDASPGRHDFLPDAMGTPLALTDASGGVDASYRHEPFGEERAKTGTTESRVGYGGHSADARTGLVYMKARYYDPDVGRFLSADRYAGRPTEPASLNRYSYAHNAPTTLHDPTGFAAEPIAGGSFGVSQVRSAFGSSGASGSSQSLSAGVTSALMTYALPLGTRPELGLTGESRDGAYHLVLPELGGVVRTSPPRNVWDDIQLTLAVTGMFPILGNLADFADGVISLARGQYAAAGLSFVAMIPIVGQLATAGKLGAGAYQAARRGRAVLRYARMGVGRTRVAQGLLRARAGVGRAAAHLASEVGESATSLLRREGDEALGFGDELLEAGRGCVRRPLCFAAGTLIAMATVGGVLDPASALASSPDDNLSLNAPIEDIEVGDRVVTIQSAEDASDGDWSETEVDESWRVVELELLGSGEASGGALGSGGSAGGVGSGNGGGGSAGSGNDGNGARRDDGHSGALHITMLRPLAWLEAHGLDQVGGALYLDLREEMGREGIGTVIDVRGPPAVADGPGRVVLTTYRLASSDVYALGVTGGDEPVLVTGTHPLFSLTRNEWVPVEKLEVGEELQAREGAVRVESLAWVPQTLEVFNLEVEGDHEYLAEGLRSHNTGGRCSQQLSLALGDEPSYQLSFEFRQGPRHVDGTGVQLTLSTPEFRFRGCVSGRLDTTCRLFERLVAGRSR